MVFAGDSTIREAQGTKRRGIGNGHPVGPHRTCGISSLHPMFACRIPLSGSIFDVTEVLEAEANQDGEEESSSESLVDVDRDHDFTLPDESSSSVACQSLWR